MYIGVFIFIRRKSVASKLRGFGCLATRPHAVKYVECCRSFLIGYLMFLLAFYCFSDKRKSQCEWIS